jgi:SOS response regulatory protein OraA/RecX
MILIKVKASKFPSQVWLIFEDKTYLPYSADDWVKQKIALPIDLSSEQYQQLIDTSFTYRLKIYSLNQIALSPKIRHDLVPKLKIKAHFLSQKYKISSPNLDTIISTVLDYLEEHDLINEKSYVDYIISKYSHKPQAYISRFLFSKGLRQHSIVKDDTELLKDILAKPKYQKLASSDYQTRQKLIASLIRKGFTYDDIKATI